MNDVMKELKFFTEDCDLSQLCELNPLSIFDETVLCFLKELSSFLIKERAYPDLVSFAYFCHNVAKYKSDYHDVLNSNFGRGVSLHYGPSNIALNYAYSFVSGLLAGNVCLVRCSRKAFPQVTVLNETIRELLEIEEFLKIKERLHIFTFDHKKKINDVLSQLCDLRVIWGGDKTIEQIRQSPLPARSYDITFANRYSLAVIDSTKYLALENKKDLALKFYNDTLLFDQNACSSPRVLCWLGSQDEVKQAQDLFWEEFSALVEERQYQNSGNVAVEKWLKHCMSAIELGATQIENGASFIRRLEIQELPQNLERYSAAGGFFLELHLTNLSEIFTFKSRKLQTLSYFGLNLDDFMNEMKSNAMLGLERVVPIGETSTFSLVWDGYDLIRQMSKKIAF